MDVKIQDDFDRHFVAIRAHSNNVQSEVLHAAIRVILPKLLQFPVLMHHSYRIFPQL